MGRRGPVEVSRDPGSGEVRDLLVSLLRDAGSGQWPVCVSPKGVVTPS